MTGPRGPDNTLPYNSVTNLCDLTLTTYYGFCTLHEVSVTLSANLSEYLSGLQVMPRPLPQLGLV